MARTKAGASIVVAVLLLGACTDGNGSEGSGDDSADVAANGDTEDGEAAGAQEEITFEGRTIRVLSIEPGGSGDVHTRAIVELLPEFLPGSPTIVVENKEGAGGLILNNELYNTDGSSGDVISFLHIGTLMNQALGVEGVTYDAAEYVYLGGVPPTSYAIPVMADSPFETWEDMFVDPPRTMTGGGGGIASTNTIIQSFLRWLGADLDVIVGYGGAGDRTLGVESGEIDTSWLSLTNVGGWLEGGDARALIRTGPEHPLLDGVPTLEEVVAEVADVDDPVVQSMLTLTNAPLQVGASWVAPPGTPGDVADAFAEALRDVHADPRFHEIAETADLVYEPWYGADEVRDIWLSILDVDAEAVELFKDEVLQGAEFDAS